MNSVRMIAASAFAAFLALTPVGVSASPPNILLVLVDDLGVEHLDFYAAQAFEQEQFYAPTQFLSDRVLQTNEFLVFQDAWSNTVCGPTRSTIQTGLYGFENGVGVNIDPDPMGFQLNLNAAFMLPKLLKDPNNLPNPYQTAAFAKTS